VAALLAYLPELGGLSRGEAALLAGLAPIANDSGATQGPRHIAGGRAALRKTLYMAALAAMRHNPVMRAFAAKLKRSGKPAKVVINRRHAQAHRHAQRRAPGRRAVEPRKDSLTSDTVA
jgi:transposase